MTAASERVYVVDDDTAVRKSVARLLRSAGFEALTFESPEEFLRLLPADAGGCAILDLAMPGRDGLAVQRELASRRIALPVVFLTGHGDIPKSVQAMKGGAADFLSKPVDDEVLLRAVRQAMRKGRADREARVRSAEVERRLATLSRREREVLEGVVSGKLNKQIGADLGIAEKTVKVHRGRMMQKMGVASVAELVHLLDGSRPPS